MRIFGFTIIRWKNLQQMHERIRDLKAQLREAEDGQADALADWARMAMDLEAAQREIAAIKEPKP